MSLGWVVDWLTCRPCGTTCLPKEFFSHPQVWFNLFDVVIITLALVGVVLTLSYSSDSSGACSSIHTSEPPKQ
eukprot:6384305-Amphidinium_carterae.2